MNSAGFYKKDTTKQIIFSTAVFSNTYSLFPEMVNSIQFPIDGWYWFDSKELADSFFEQQEIQEKIAGDIQKLEVIRIAAEAQRQAAGFN